MKRISYIVPVYNAERYLAGCIDSILAQTGEEIELILVDDGSSDRSGSLCDGYAAKDGRVTVIHQRNSGVSAARNAGLDAAGGEYIRFVDADDGIVDNDEVALLTGMTADWLTAGAVVLDENGRVLRRITPALQGEYTTRAVLLAMDSPLKRVTLHYVWNHFYKRDIIEREGLRFDSTLSLGEDFLFNVAYLDKCAGVGYIDTPIARYYKRDNGSLTGRFKEGELARRRQMDGAFAALFQSRDLAAEQQSAIERMVGEIAYASLLKVQQPLPPRTRKARIRFLDEMFCSEYHGLILAYLAAAGRQGLAKRLEYALIAYKCKWAFYLLRKIKCRWR